MKGVAIIILALILGVFGVVMLPLIDEGTTVGDNTTSPSGVSGNITNMSADIGTVTTSLLPVIVLILVVMGGIVMLGGLLKI